MASTSWQESAVHLHHKVKGHLFENGRAQSLRAGCLKEVIKRLSVCSWSSLYLLASPFFLPVQFLSKLNSDCNRREELLSVIIRCSGRQHPQCFVRWENYHHPICDLKAGIIPETLIIKMKCRKKSVLSEWTLPDRFCL